MRSQVVSNSRGPELELSGFWQSRQFSNNVSLLGASLVSGIGSLVLHLAPFITFALIADSRASVAVAGWVRSLTQFGEIAVTIGLPLLGIMEFRRRAITFTALAFVGGLAMATSREIVVLMVGWLVVGACSGVMKYLGTMAAAKSSRLTYAFSLRLAVVLTLAGLASIYVITADVLRSYNGLLIHIIVFSAIILLIGGLFLNNGSIVNDNAAKQDRRAADAENASLWAVSGLAVLALFFVGVSGVLVYAIHQAVDRGLSLWEVAFAMAGTKLLVGAWLLTSSYFSSRRDGEMRFLFQALLLISATTAIYLSRDNYVLFLSLLSWEISVNTLSARLQAAVVSVSPRASRWLNLTILVGGAIGPALNGAAISIGHGYAYVIFGAATALAPVFWYGLFRSRNPGFAS